MSGIPNTIPKLGDAQLKPRQNPDFVPGRDFGTEDYYVWSRCDGTASLHDIILMVGIGTERSIAILGKLRQIGAVLLPGEAQPVSSGASKSGAESAAGSDELSNAIPTPTRNLAVGSSRTTAPRSARVSKSGPVSRPASASGASAASSSAASAFGGSASVTLPSPAAVRLSSPNEEEASALALDLELPHEYRVRILQYRRRIESANLFELLEIEAEDSDTRSIKRAYFRLSKEFHPDRHYGKELGPFAHWLAEVFKAVTDAFKVLGDKKKRAKYESALRGDSGQHKPQSKEEHAHVLFLSACDAELHGDFAEALRYFAASIRMNEQARVLRRAAMCAVQGQQLSVAAEYAKKAARLCAKDASYLRTLADVYRAGRRLQEAQGVLERALALDIESDVLFSEIKADLASVKASIEEIEAQES